MNILPLFLQYLDSHCVKGYLVNDSQNQGYFTLTIYETYYQVTMFDNTNRINLILFLAVLILNKMKVYLFLNLRLKAVIGKRLNFRLSMT